MKSKFCYRIRERNLNLLLQKSTTIPLQIERMRLSNSFLFPLLPLVPRRAEELRCFVRSALEHVQPSSNLVLEFFPTHLRDTLTIFARRKTPKLRRIWQLSVYPLSIEGNRYLRLNLQSVGPWRLLPETPRQFA